MTDEEYDVLGVGRIYVMREVSRHLCTYLPVYLSTFTWREYDKTKYSKLG